MDKADKNANKWLSKTEFDFFKKNISNIEKIYQYAMTLNTNQCVLYLYDYFKKHLPNFFNNLCNIVFSCNVIDLRKDKTDKDLYDRYLKYAKKWFDRTNVKIKEMYKEIFQDEKHPQIIFLQRIPDGFAKIGLVYEEEPIYWWIDKDDLKCIDDLIHYIASCDDYFECVKLMRIQFISYYLSKPSVYMNEEKTQAQKEKQLMFEEQSRQKFLQKLTEIQEELKKSICD